jgi:hypothetical protein
MAASTLDDFNRDYSLAYTSDLLQRKQQGFEVGELADLSDADVATSVAHPTYQQGLDAKSKFSVFESTLAGGSHYEKTPEDAIAALVTSKDVEGAKKYLDVDSIGTLASQIKQQSKLAGVSWSNKGANDQFHMTYAAKQLADKGVSDLKQLRKQGNDWVNTATGKVVVTGDTVGATAYGEGYTNYKLAADSKGRPILYQQWESSTDKGKIAAGLGLVLNLVGTALGNAIGLTGGVATAVGGGLISGGLAAAGGASGEGILRSALSAGVAPVLGSIPGFTNLAPVAQRVITGATSGVVRTGSSRGALLGAVTGSIPGNMTGNAQLDRLLRAVLTNQVQRRVMKP